MEENKIEEIQSHLSHIVDKLSAISSNACIIEMLAGEISKNFKAQNKTVSVKELTEIQNNAVAEAQSIVDEIRKILA